MALISNSNLEPDALQIHEEWRIWRRKGMPSVRHSLLEGEGDTMESVRSVTVPKTVFLLRPLRVDA